MRRHNRSSLSASSTFRPAGQRRAWINHPGLFASLLAIALPASRLDAQTISTIAGGGPPANSAATSVGVAPFNVAIDGNGNIYFTTPGFDNNVYRLSGGALNRVAGNDGSGFQGDGGPATSALLNYPTGIAVDRNGNLYIADVDNYRVRAVNMQSTTVTLLGVSIGPGQIATVAGNGTEGYAGDGGPAISAEIGITSSGVDSGLAVDASGNLFIADTFGGHIREVNTAGTISTVVGTTNKKPDFCYNGPITSTVLWEVEDVAFDAAGNLYYSDAGLYCVEVVNRSSTPITVLGVTVPAGYVAPVAGNGKDNYSGDGGPATEAEINTPVQIAFDSSGDLFIADYLNFDVREVNPSGTISTFAGIYNTEGALGDGGPAVDAFLELPAGVAADASGNVYIAAGDRLRMVNTSGTISTVAGEGFLISGNGGPATQAQLDYPQGILAGTSGLYIADQAEVRLVNSMGNISIFAGTGTGGYSGDNGPATSAAMEKPAGVALDGAGNFYISDQNASVIRKVNAGGTITTIAGGGSGCSQETDQYGDGCPATEAQFFEPQGLAVDGSGNLYIADTLNGLIRAINNHATPVTLYGVTIAAGDIAVVAGGGMNNPSTGGSALNAALSSPSSIVVDSAGTLYIADPGYAEVLQVDSGGSISVFAGEGGGSAPGPNGDGGPALNASLALPSGLTLDSAGDVFIADSGHQRIRVVNMQSTTITSFGVSIAPGNIATMAGDGTQGFTGDGGLATAADLNYPTAMALDAAGNLYINDSDNKRIRKVTPATSSKLTPTVTVSPAEAQITTKQPDTVTVTVSGGNGNPTPTGTVTLTSGTYNSGATALSSGSAMITIPAGSLAVGSDTLTATYSWRYELHHEHRHGARDRGAGHRNLLDFQPEPESESGVVCCGRRLRRRLQKRHPLAQHEHAAGL